MLKNTAVLHAQLVVCPTNVTGCVSIVDGDADDDDPNGEVLDVKREVRKA